MREESPRKLSTQPADTTYYQGSMQHTGSHALRDCRQVGSIVHAAGRQTILSGQRVCSSALQHWSPGQLQGSQWLVCYG